MHEHRQIIAPDTEPRRHGIDAVITARKEHVARCDRAGDHVVAGFIVGFDTETKTVAEDMVECIEATSIPICMVGAARERRAARLRRVRRPAMPDRKNSKTPDYAVGYGRPPNASQFAAGKSGNPKGRPKGSRSVGAVLQDIIQQKIVVTENGKTRRIPALEVMLRGRNRRNLADIARGYPDLRPAFRRDEAWPRSRLPKVVVPLSTHQSSRWQPAPSSDGRRRRLLPLVREIVRYGDALVRPRRLLLGHRLAKPVDPVLGIWMRRQQARQPDADRPRERVGRDPLLRHID